MNVNAKTMWRMEIIYAKMSFTIVTLSMLILWAITNKHAAHVWHQNTAYDGKDWFINIANVM